MNVDSNRSSAMRQHRVLGHYLAIQAWIRKLDCIVINREDLQSFLGLQRFKGSRVRWLMEDLKSWFPFQQPFYLTRSPSSIGSLFLSRVPISDHLPTASMRTEERIANRSSTSPEIGIFVPEGWSPPTEQDIIAQLAVISAGLAVPQDYKAKRTVPKRMRLRRL